MSTLLPKPKDLIEVPLDWVEEHAEDLGVDALAACLGVPVRGFHGTSLPCGGGGGFFLARTGLVKTFRRKGAEKY